MRQNTDSIRFQSTLPRRERRIRTTNTNTLSFISIHAPAKGATGKHAHIPIRHTDFNPRSREGSDGNLFFTSAQKADFNPRSREGSDKRQLPNLRNVKRFQSTLPRRERLSVLLCIQYSHRNFNPRSREGSDIIFTGFPSSSIYFNPRSREGSDSIY